MADDPAAGSSAPADERPPTEADTARTVHERLEHLEALVSTGMRRGVEAAVVPAWRRLTVGEPRWPVTIAVVAALTMQATLPRHLILGPRWLLTGLGGVLLIALVAANPGRIDRTSTVLRSGSLALIGLLSIANGWSAGRLVYGLVTTTETADAPHLLLSGGAIWLVNVIAFALWYWEFDRDGPVGRMMGTRPYPDFQFPQMENPQLAPPEWEPRFADYFYTSFTNATAFSPTDVMPLSRWAKLTMLAQSAISLTTVALVVARAVNILK
jgi:hypothetical protein